VVDANGNWHIAFDAEENVGEYDIYYGLYHDDIWVWQEMDAPLGQFGSGAHPEMVVDDQGRAHIFYRAASMFYVIHHTFNHELGGTTWQTEVLLNSNLENFTTSAIWSREYGLRVAVSGNDGFGMPGHIFYHARPPESGWLPPDLVTAASSAVNGQLGLDSWGHPIIVWEETMGSVSTGNIFFSIRTAQWNSFPLISNGESYYPLMAIDSEDRGSLIFSTNPYPDDEEIYFFGPEPSSIANSTRIVPVPDSPVLYPPYPNPFNATVILNYDLPHASMTTLTISNILGQKVVTLFDGMKQCGQHNAIWDANPFPSGVYFARLQSDYYMKTIKMVLLK